METSIIISGFGGQGALFAGQLLAYAAMDAGRHVTWIPSYGPEMRGGTAHCTVIISDRAIGAPLVNRPDVAVVLNGPSFEKYERLVLPGGLLVVNSSIVEARSTRSDIEIMYVDGNDIAERMGSGKMMNVALIGAMLAGRPVLKLRDVEQALAEHLPTNKAHLLEGNIQTLRRGFAVDDTINV